jgi:hypothetical protein
MSLGNKLERFSGKFFKLNSLQTNMSTGWRGLPGAKELAYFASFSLKEMKNKLKHLFLVSL